MGIKRPHFLVSCNTILKSQAKICVLCNRILKNKVEICVLCSTILKNKLKILVSCSRILKNPSEICVLCNAILKFGGRNVYIISLKECAGSLDLLEFGVCMHSSHCCGISTRAYHQYLAFLGYDIVVQTLHHGYPVLRQTDDIVGAFIQVCL